VNFQALALVFSASLLGIGLVRAQPEVGLNDRAPITPLPRPERGDVRKVALGRDLFFDRRLSGSRKLSCASCHDLSSNGATALKADRGDAGRVLSLNTPTVFNSVHSFRFGWEGKSRTLHELSLMTLRTEHLMSSGGIAARRLADDPTMKARFRAIYGAPPDENNLVDALVAFMKTLVTPDAPFDRWLRGDKTALTPQQVRGYNRFTVVGCTTCHQGVNVGANIFQRRGIFHPLGEANPRYIRVPSLRNVTVTAPYFHDGSVSSLPEAIRRMARSQLDLTISERDIMDISAFLESLTGSYQGRRLRPAASSSRK
jgi:cytochrome c peroxidase